MSPFEIARETLKRLAQQRTVPTPDNYRALYHEIAGTAEHENFPEKPLKALAAALPRATPEQLRFARQLDGAIGARNWEGVQSALTDLLNRNAAEPPNWSALIRDLVLRLEARQTDLTPARKREALERVLSATPTPELLHTRLQGLLKGWAQGNAPEAAQDAGADPAAAGVAG
ncbi:MAG: GGDEF domain-containing protein, partial [Sulfuritalea sp.]|nr:GGDEF domain-containing protein [Sulfuritalea sp.]